MASRPKIPSPIKKQIEEETFGICADPKCFKPATQRHHIDGNNKNNDPANLIYICGACHDLHHYRKKYTNDNFFNHKKYLKEFTPDKMYSLEEIIFRMKSYYEQGKFSILNNAVNILFKFNNEKIKLDKKITAWLYELLAEINIQTTKLWDISNPVTKAMAGYSDLKDFDSYVHATGLFAINFIKNNLYEPARSFLKVAKETSETSLSDKQKSIRLGWINNVLSDISIKSNKLNEAQFYAEESIKYYECVYNELCFREKADIFFQTAKVIVAKGEHSALIDAEELLNKSKELLLKSGWEQSIIKWHIIQFQRYKKINEIEEAKNHLYLAWDINKNSNEPPETKNILYLIKEHMHLCLEEIIVDLYEKHKSCNKCNKSEAKNLVDCSLTNIF